MPGYTDTEVLAFDSQSPPLSPLYKLGTEVVNEELLVFQDTIPLDDIMVPDSPERLEDDTQVLDARDCVEEEVVIDSDDEDHGSGRVSVLGASNSHKMAADEHEETGGNVFVESDASNDQECQTGIKGSASNIVRGYEENDPPQMITGDHDARLNFMESQEPGELTQANALDFVDHFIKDNAANLSPAISSAKILRIKSPPISSAKGPQSLAKRIKTRTQMNERIIFDWVDNSQHEGNDSTHPNSSAESCRTEQVFEANPVNIFITQLDEQLEEETSKQQHEAQEDLLDIGINTQIAAETMEALSYAAHARWSTNIAGEGPGKTLEDFPRDLMKKKPNESDNCSFQKSPSPCIGGTARKSKRKEPSTRKFDTRNQISFDKISDKQKLVLDLATTTNRQMNQRTPAITIKSIDGSSCKLIEHSIAEEAARSRSSRVFQIHLSSSTMSEHDSVDKRQSKQKPFAHQSAGSVSGGGPGRTGDDSHDKGETIDGVMENHSLIYNRKRRSADSAQFEITGGSERMRKSTQQEQGDLNVAALTGFLKFDRWNVPRRKRSRLIVQSQNSAANKPQPPLTVVGGKEFKTVRRRCHKLLTDHKKVACYISEQQASNTFIDPSSLTYSRNMFNGYHKNPSKQNVPKKSLLKELVSLGVPGVLSDITWRDLRKRRTMAYIRVLFSQHMEEDVIKQQKKIAARLGISVADSSLDSTHFIADRFARTRNMLEAMALGKPVVTHLWLESCEEASCLIHEKSYILKDSKKEKEIGFCMPTSLARANQSPLLKAWALNQSFTQQGITVFITPNIKPDREMIVSLVKAVHGQVVERNQIFAAEDRKILDPFLILSCEDDQEICLPLINRGATVYSSELLLSGIVTQKLEYERYRLFTGGHGRNRRTAKFFPHDGYF